MHCEAGEHVALRFVGRMRTANVAYEEPKEEGDYDLKSESCLSEFD